MPYRCSRFAATLFFMATIFGSAHYARADINRPFGSHPMTYAMGSILPNHVSQATLDQAVRDFYDEWKDEYLLQTCGAGRYVVVSHGGSGTLTVSEAHGYGMMLAALMAGHDPEAQTVFDGMFAYFLEHPTATHDRLMSWNQTTSCNDAQGNNSATDGDLDIAFALLLADKQWGSCGSIDYHEEAMAVLEDVLDGEVDATQSFTLLGDWVTPGVPPYDDSTRSSDFMVDHFASFASASGSTAWTDLRDSLYSIVASLQTTHSAGVGLVPDFIVDPATSPAPAPAMFLEGANDGKYSYNACRVPWRLATDFVASGDSRAKTALDTLNSWIRTKTSDDPSDITAGYSLNGDSIPGTDYISLAFIAPFGVGAMVNSANQDWLNDVWDFTVTTPIGAENYYENTIKLLSMLVMSGNWWAPEAVGAATCTPAGTDLCTNPAAVSDASVKLRGLDRGPAAQKMTLRGTLFFPGGVPAALDAGAQILLEDIGSGDAAIFDLTEATSVIAGVGDPVCDPRDSWKSTASKVQYRNKSGALDAPTCTAGSANGLSKVLYRTKDPTDLPFQIRTKKSTTAPPVGPLRVTLVLGDDAAAGDAGQCGVTAPLACAVDTKRADCE
ncbi:MAG: glycosyl hydrolase family 8 [Candidatus Binatia bacterium]